MSIRRHFLTLSLSVLHFLPATPREATVWIDGVVFPCRVLSRVTPRNEAQTPHQFQNNKRCTYAFDNITWITFKGKMVQELRYRQYPGRIVEGKVSHSVVTSIIYLHKPGLDVCLHYLDLHFYYKVMSYLCIWYGGNAFSTRILNVILGIPT